MSRFRKNRKERKQQLKNNHQFKRLLSNGKIIECCEYCRNAFLVLDLTIDHVVALCFGGKNSIENVVLSCKECNWNKGRREWLEFKKQQREFIIRKYKLLDAS